ncbi:MAG: DNA mismatch repair endonuclease MutL, partial [Clostridia bacterium]|nr:DNA mismatch repair endonuclease MutL [Clostridia bacterium]
MGKINLLSEIICNRIAAGEVIERPYSAVKELIENSIDAGATEIEIHIERGGKDLIRVIDNGCGIEKDDMRAAFFPHATSKISELDDIDHIHTLGFRGEALATIASIACVELISAVEGQEGNKVECDGEFIGKVYPAEAPRGTQISITKFFFNTPVRFKFMKSDKKEEADITNYVTYYILGYPDISFKYFVDGKLTLQSYGGGLEEAITQVYGANYLPNCFKISAERNDIKISGFISNQNFFKSNKTYQNVFLNGRHVVNPVIASAITNAYASYAMKRQYPFYVL